MSLLSDDDKALLALEHLGPAALAGDTMSLYDCFQLALDVAEKEVMAKLASAELPEPALSQGKYGYRVSSEDYYTADQLRQAYAQGAASQLATCKNCLQVEPLLKDMLDTLPYNTPEYWIERIRGALSLYTRRQA